MGRITSVALRVVSLLPLVVSSACGGSGPPGKAKPSAVPSTLAATGSDEADAVHAGNNEITFPADGIDLVGTLSIPQVAVKGHPVPAVVLVHGSGPHSRTPRYEGQLNMAFGFSVPVFQQLTDSLLAAGFAVLAYDKRSCGRFNNCAANEYHKPAADVTIDTFVQDVQAAVNYLRTLDRIEPTQVFVVGHSEGGKIALEMVQRGTGVNTVVMLAANHRPVDALLEYQVSFSRRLLRESGMSEEQIASLLTPIGELLGQAQAARRGQVDSTNRYLRSWIELDDRTVAGVTQLTRPVLAIGGDYDWNVPADDVRAWEASFNTVAEHKGHKAVLVQCVTHALNCISEPDPKKLSTAALGRDLHPPVAALVVDFLRSQTAAPANE